jgi:hypothetical protein
MCQVANFEYIDEAKALAAKEEARRKAEAEAASNKANFWEDLLKDRYVAPEVEEDTAMGKGKRSRKQVHLSMFVLSDFLLFLQIQILTENLHLFTTLSNLYVVMLHLYKQTTI